jgi:putative membrane fusion protein
VTLTKKKHKGIKSTQKAKIAIGLIIIFAVIYIPSLFYWLYSENVNTDLVKFGNLEDSINAEGYLFRKEYVLKSTQKGIFFSDVNEGERVQSFSRIVSILSDKNKELLLDLNQKDQKLIEYHRQISKKSGVVSYEVQKVDDYISKKMEEIVLADNSNNISRIVGLKAEIESLIKKKVQIISSLGLKDDFFNKIKEERNMIKKNIDSNTSEISAPSSGMVSYMVDGLEDKLTFENMRNFKPWDLRNLTNNTIFLVPEDSNVEENKPIAKIITDNEYYISIILKSTVKDGLVIGKDVKVRIIPINRTITGKIDYISEENDGEVVMFIKVDRALAETSSFRKLNISIIKSAYSGFKIPIKSLIEFSTQSKKAKIMLIKGGVARLVEITVTGYDAEFAIVENDGNPLDRGINLYDMYVVDGMNVKEGQFIN